MKPEEWIAEFAAAIGADAPDATTVDELLDLAAVAAHSSERTAAPIACYLAGPRRASDLRAEGPRR